MKYNILYLHNKSDISGGERSLLNLWQEIDRKRFQPFLIVPREGRLSEEAGKINVPVAFMEAPKLAAGNLLSVTRKIISLKKYMRNNKIDLLHAYSPRNNVIGAIVCRLAGVPVIWHERNMLYGGEKDMTCRSFFLPDRIICNSRVVSERFKKRGRIPDKVDIVLNGVDTDRFNPDIDPGEFKREMISGRKKVVGLVTNLSKRKRVEFFIDAAGKILKKDGDAAFVIAGGDFSDHGQDRMSVFKRMVKDRGLEKDIIFTGFRNNMPEVISIFDVAVNVTEKEACSRAILEYMACGKAVVAMNDGGSPELIDNGKTGILVDPQDMSGFVSAVTDLLMNSDRRDVLGANARRSVEEKFNIKRNTKETEDIYLGLLGEKR